MNDLLIFGFLTMCILLVCLRRAFVGRACPGRAYTKPLGVLVLVLLAVLAFAPAQATTITEYVVPGNPGVWDVAVNSTHVWFTEGAGNNIGVIEYMTFSPSLRQIPVPTSNSQPWGITMVPWPNAQVVFTEAYGSRIGIVSNNSTLNVLEYQIPTTGSSPRKIIYDWRPGQNCTWFTEYIGKIGRFNTTGWTPNFAEYALPSGSTPIGIAVDPNEPYVWYADFSRKTIGRLDPGSSTSLAQVREYPVAPFSPWDVTLDPDGMIWFTAQEVGTGRNSICKLNPVAFDRPSAKYSLSVFSVPTPNSEVHDIEIDNSTGNVWFTEFSDYASKIGRYSPHLNTFAEYSIITPGAKPQGLSIYNETSTGPVNIWFAEYGGRRVGRLRQPEGPTVTTTVYSISKAVSTSTTVTVTNTWITSKATATTAATLRTTHVVTFVTWPTASSTLVDTLSTALTSPTYYSTTYTYTTSTSYTTSTTTYRLTLLTVETTSTTTSITATYVSTSWESITLLTTATVQSISWFSETTSTTISSTQTTTTFPTTTTVPTTVVTGASTTIYSPTVTITSVTSTATTTTTTSTLMTTATVYSPTMTLTSTTTTTTTAIPLGVIRPCIIASAAYGSELTPEVQSLRGFRDREVLSTFAGRSFMEVFNEFYYSFSPVVARTVASSQTIAAPVRVLLYPLIGILQASSTAFHAMDLAPEAGIVLAGVFASALIGIVYVTPLVLGIRYLLKKEIRINKLRIGTLAGR
jgi:streptogramin lyase